MASTSPIVFATRHFKPDTCLQVFSKEFHVHSSVLRLFSAFFRAFLESADKVPLTGKFRYHWITEVEADGSWALRCVNAGTVHGQTAAGNIDHATVTSHQNPSFQTRQEIAFEKLLCALHCRAYSLTDIEEFEALIQLGDYYRSLPILSQSIHIALFQSNEFLLAIPRKSVELLPLAAKVRNSVLFKECLIHLLGPWIAPQYHLLQDHSLKSLADTIYKRVCGQILWLQGRIMVVSSYSDGIRKGALAAAKNAEIQSKNGRRTINWPAYVKEVYDVALTFPARLSDCSLSHSEIAPLMKSNLVLDRSGDKTGQGIYEEHFLYPEILDEELPWDMDQKYWRDLRNRLCIVERRGPRTRKTGMDLMHF